MATAETNRPPPVFASQESIPDIVWAASVATVTKFGPPLAVGTASARPVISTTTGKPIDCGGLRFLVVSGWVPETAEVASHSAVPADLEEARRSAAASAGVNLVLDRLTGKIEIISGIGSTRPVFLMKDNSGAIRVLEGVSGLRLHPSELTPTIAGVSHLLGFGHPPPGESVLYNVWALQAGESRSLQVDDVKGWQMGVPRRAYRSAPLNDLTDDLCMRLETAVRGKSVAVVAAYARPMTNLVETACRAAGASRVERADALRLSLGYVQSVATALTGLPMADVALLADMAAAMEGAVASDVVVLDWGSDAWWPCNPAHRRFATALARRASAPTRSVAGGYLRVGGFVRDLLFAETSVFSDEERFSVIGSALIQEGFVAMADEFGDVLETVEPAEAPAVAARISPGYQLGGSAAALRVAVAALTKRLVLAPFLDASPPNASPKLSLYDVAKEISLTPDDIVSDRLGEILSDRAAVFGTLALLSRTPPMLRLLSQREAGSVRARRQAFCILALEKWIRAVGALEQGGSWRT